MTLPAHVISIDPGLATGMALIATDGPVLMQSAEPQPMEVEGVLREMLAQVDPADLLVVSEKFTITARTAQNTQAPWSLEVTGIVRNLVYHLCGLQLAMQKPDVRMKWTTARQQILECWHVGGEGHANDAIKHALEAMWSRGWRDTRVVGV